MDTKNNAVKTGPRIAVRKSVFFATVFTVTNEIEAHSLVKEMKRKDRKARHIAFAFRTGVNPVKEGMSDDGEPRGTAGMPILMILRHSNLKNMLVTVTRYYGGVKLGPGNLKRAYRDTAKAALEIKKNTTHECSLHQPL